MRPRNNRSWTPSVGALMLLGTMFGLMVSTINRNALTVDEPTHIGAGYAYLTQRDYRLNPEHPPLVKDLAALPLLRLHPTFPEDRAEWTDAVTWGWRLGWVFLFEVGNPGDTMIFWARLPPLGLTLLLGWFIFRWGRERYGSAAGLGALGLYTFAPAFLAHGSLVTTDVAAAAGCVVATYYFLRFLQGPSRRRLLLAGLTLGGALLTKFSTFVLVPFFLAVAILWGVLRASTARPDRLASSAALLRALPRRLAREALRLMTLFLIATVTVWVVYAYHVLEYPPERQRRDISERLTAVGAESWTAPVSSMADNPTLRPLAHYLLGLLMAAHRTGQASPTYFLGEVSKAGRWYYFPVVYLLKEPLPLLLGEALALIIGVLAVMRGLRRAFRDQEVRGRAFARLAGASERQFPELVMGAFIALYWCVSLAADLNIGLRHVLPTFPFVYLLVGATLVRWGFWSGGGATAVIAPWSLRQALRRPCRRGARRLIVVLLLLWYAGSTLAAYPHFLSYFNPIGGGSRHGYRYAVDSNYDWGQDLKRLAHYVRERGIERIHLDYFGGALPAYYLEERSEPWSLERGRPEGWFAISATVQQEALGVPDPPFIEAVSQHIRAQAARLEVHISPALIHLIAENAAYDLGIALRHFEAVAQLAARHPQREATREDVEAVLHARSYHWLRAYPVADRVGQSLFIYYGR